MKEIKYLYNGVEVILYINNVNYIDLELLQNIKDMIHKNRLLYIENNDGLFCCDTPIYNTCYNMFNIKVVGTFKENEAGQETIIKCEFFFDLFKSDKIIYFDKKEFLKDKILLESITL